MINQDEKQLLEEVTKICHHLERGLITIDEACTLIDMDNLHIVIARRLKKLFYVSYLKSDAIDLLKSAILYKK